ncbi:MAG: ATP-dependent DNA ligase [Chloroflexota bacterium]|nr:ATP-dependent DNA ligase [Chloroflexota bacterium]
MAVRPPLAPMLARLARELPGDGFSYEPKWDGFRCLAFREGDQVDLRSRHDRPFARYFPEIVEALRALPAPALALDGELVVVTERGFDFAALLGRLHPAASRVERLRREAPAAFVAFDLIALGGRDLRGELFGQRRAALERLLEGCRPPLHLTPLTRERVLAARWLSRYQGGGVDGVVAKHDELRYEPGARAMVKVKHERTAECVVGGLRPVLGGEPLAGSLLLGLYDAADRLHHIGVVAAFPRAQRRSLYSELSGLIVPLAGHPWEHGFLVEGGALGRLAGSAGRWTPDMSHDWWPLAPERVCEVAFDQVDGHRLRHPARFRRWRPDRDPRSCRLEQLEAPTAPIADLLSS